MGFRSLIRASQDPVTRQQHFAASVLAVVALVLLLSGASGLRAHARVRSDGGRGPVQPSSLDATTPSLSPAWLSVEADNTESVAWGDYDGDGDLDLVVGGSSIFRLYRNEDGVVTPIAVWSSIAGGDICKSIAWGDYDGDGDLDLAVGNYNQSNRLYRNDQGGLTFSAVWSSAEADLTYSVAWGDYDGDGDLDLVAGDWRRPKRLYRNDQGVLTSSAVWLSVEQDDTKSIAWGDYDGDGDLDLAVGNYSQPNRLYRNDEGVLTSSAVWSSAETDYTESVAWGDYDDDGDLDLAVGNYRQANRLYRNDSGNLTTSAVWSSVEADWTHSVAWGDYDGDGDLDLAVGNWAGFNRLYRNDGGALTASAVWSSALEEWTYSLAWGDYDSDGDLDLAVGNYGQPNRIYRNNHVPLGLNTAWSYTGYGYSVVAWGDYDGDGDLDLAVGYYGQANRLYRNDGGILTPGAIWSSAAADDTVSIAWGDYDGDGDLDLAVGNYSQPNRLYRNDQGGLTSSAVWSSAEADQTYSVAWGDYDGDGDLDLAAGNYGISRLYRNDEGVLTPSAVWSSADAYQTYSVAWGDYDGDSDLDLVFGNNGATQLHRNDNGTLTASAVWSSAETHHTESVAWSDYDGDGDLDLAIGNYGQANRLYRNDSGNLTTSAVWSSVEADWTRSVAWGDYDGDGDSDLVVGNYGVSNRLYRNDDGTLTANAVWSSIDVDDTQNVVWGDQDNDGDLDLAVGNAGSILLYTNTRTARTLTELPGSGTPSRVRLTRPPPPGDANYYSAPNIWPASGAVIPIRYTLSQPDSRPVAYIRAYYSLNGGGQWLPAVAASGTITGNLAASPTGIDYTYHWDVFASGVFGQSDNVVFRIVAMPDLHPVANAVPGPFLFGSNASDTFPFRVRGTQVRVLENGAPVPGALVYRQPAGQTAPAALITGLADAPFQTDGQGYLQGRGAINAGDRLFALAPVTATASYTLYHTSAAPTLTGLEPFTVTAGGVQTLTVSASHPLLLFNLDVALEWDARQDTQFLAQLHYDLARAAEFLFDWTDGQATLGHLRIFHDAPRQPEVNGWQPWQGAHVRIYASNRLRPSAVMGGIVSQPLSETVPISASPVITYTPGQVYMAATWNRYGNPGSSLDEDWPRTLAHELGHFAFFLEDNYLGRDAAGLVIPIDACPGAMADPYRDDAAAGYGEFHPDAAWLPACAQTLSNLTTGRSDWATIESFYPALNGAEANPGPSTLPLAVTGIQFVAPVTPTTTLKVPIFYLTQDGQRVQPGSTARAFLFQDDWAADLGRPTLDQLLARGARPGDRVCLYEPGAGRLGCETVSLGDEQLTLVSRPAWQPDIQVSPVTSVTHTVAVADLPAGLALRARLYPLNTPAGAAITLAAAGDGYAGTFTLSAPAFEGYVQVWVDEAEPRREAIIDYTLGGNPGHERSGGGHERSGGGHERSGGAPVISADGQVILFAPDVTLPDEWFYTLQATSAGSQPPPWATQVGQAYRLAATANAPSLVGSALSFNYLGSEVPPGEEPWLKLYFRAGTDWQLLPTTLDTYHNMASTPTQGPGVYALMSSIEVPLEAPGWNFVSYPVPASRPVTEALISITGYYTTVYGYSPADVLDPWKVYDVTVPEWVNDLRTLEFGRGYWINVLEALTLRLRGASSASAAQGQNPDRAESVPLPPATYYGQVLPGRGFAPEAGMLLTASIGDQVCGTGETRMIDGAVVYSINVSADGSGTTAGCGVEGRVVTFQVDGRMMATSTRWDSSRIWELPLRPNTAESLFMPMILAEP